MIEIVGLLFGVGASLYGEYLKNHQKSLKDVVFRLLVIGIAAVVSAIVISWVTACQITIGSVIFTLVLYSVFSGLTLLKVTYI